MLFRNLLFATLTILLLETGLGRANPPVAAYIFPAGGQRGTTVNVRVGGLFLHERCGFEMSGSGVEAPHLLQRTPTLWFEGPLLPLPESQQAEDYPKDLAGSIRIGADAPVGARSWRVWTSQGAAAGAVKFQVGDLPEIVEQEIEGDPVPVEVKLPVTINGRIFPRENVDSWSFEARPGQSITCEVCAARLGSPLDSRLEVLDPRGVRIAENDDAFGADSMLRFTAAIAGKYQVRIHDVNFRGGPAYVYRLTLTTDPYVDRVYPLGGRRGTKVALTLSGQGLSKESVEIQLPTTGPRDHAHRLTIGTKSTNTFLLDLDDLPEYLETEPNDRPEQVKPVIVPAILNGRIHKPGDVDYWALSLRKGEKYGFDLRARSLGSPLHAVLTLADAAGMELARSDTPASGKMDPTIQFTVPADGTYFVRVAEAFHSRGGPEYAYRLRIASPGAPEFRLRLVEDVLTINRGGQAQLKIVVEPPAPAPIRLTVEGLPPGVTAADSQIGANQGTGGITLKADKSAPIRVGRLTVRGTMKLGDRTIANVATWPGPRGGTPVDTVLLAVALPTPFKIVGKHDMRWASRGTVAHRHYQIERGGFNGPIEIRLADRQARHLQGVTGPAIAVPPGANEFDYPIHLPPWMETGRTCRVCIMASGIVKDADGSEQTVSFSSTQVNEQIIFVVEPGKLDVEAEHTSFLAVPGQSIEIPVRVTRGKTLQGPVKLEMVRAAHLRGIAAEPIVVAAERDQAVFTIRFGSDLGPINVPVVLRATALENGEPVVAETKLDLQPKN